MTKQCSLRSHRRAASVALRRIGEIPASPKELAFPKTKYLKQHFSYASFHTLLIAHIKTPKAPNAN